MTKLFFVKSELHGRKLNLPIVGVVKVGEDNSIECEDEKADQLIGILKESPNEVALKKRTPEDVVGAMNTEQLKEFIKESNGDKAPKDLEKWNLKALKKYVLKLIKGDK